MISSIPTFYLPFLFYLQHLISAVSSGHISFSFIPLAYSHLHIPSYLPSPSSQSLNHLISLFHFLFVRVIFTTDIPAFYPSDFHFNTTLHCTPLHQTHIGLYCDWFICQNHRLKALSISYSSSWPSLSRIKLIHALSNIHLNPPFLRYFFLFYPFHSFATLPFSYFPLIL